MTEVPPANTTKQCPFCAETIQAAAIVCRYCGRDLVAPATPIMAPAISRAPDSREEDRQYIARSIAEYSKSGWQVVSQTDTTAQLKKPKEWNRAGVALFVGLPLLVAVFWGPAIYFAIFGLLLILADYLLKKEQVQFISTDEIRRQTAEQAGNVARIVPTGDGGFRCSSCNGGLRQDATVCKHCGKKLIVGAAVYAVMGSQPSEPPKIE